MRVAVVGLRHLGLVTAACLAARSHEVIGVDDREIVDGISRGVLPLSQDEPNLRDALYTAHGGKLIEFTWDYRFLQRVDVIWIALDTPVTEQNTASVQHILDVAALIAAHARPETHVLLSSQVPLGTTARVAQLLSRPVAYLPENLKRGQGVQRFLEPDRVIVGMGTNAHRVVVDELLYFVKTKIYVTVTEAEMVKHAINSLLALCITWTNELAAVCVDHNIDPEHVMEGVVSDARIGRGLPLKPGSPIKGGTLLRDVRFLEQIRGTLKTPVIDAIIPSNEARLTNGRWSCTVGEHAFTTNSRWCECGERFREEVSA